MLTMEMNTTEELDALMKEFPDWKHQFPDISRDVQVPRYSKMAGKKYDFSSPADVTQKRAKTVPHSHYQSTFPHHQDNYRPRSTKKPPPTPRIKFPPPMTFETNQRTEFTPKELSVRAEPIIMEQQYKGSADRFATISAYQQDYPGHKLVEGNRIIGPVIVNRNDHPLNSSCKLNSRTTNKEHFKHWQHAPAKPFRELPTFTGSILYPDRGHDLETTTLNTFKGLPGKPAELVHMSRGNLKSEGVFDMKTTNALTFHSFDGARPAQRITQKPEDLTVLRGRFNSDTQSKRDFPGFKGRQPAPPKPAQPAPETIDLKFDNKQEFETEQRKNFLGVDPKEHPVPKMFKKDAETYKPPDVKLETVSSQRRDYRPIDIQAYSRPVKPANQELEASLPKLDDITMNKQFFKKWELPRRVRYGDFHEAHSHVPPAEKFSATTTNQDVFLGKMSEIPNSYKPQDKAIDSQGEADFQTMYKTTFKTPSVAKLMNKKQAEKLLFELRKRKRDQPMTMTQACRG